MYVWGVFVIGTMRICVDVYLCEGKDREKANRLLMASGMV